MYEWLKGTHIRWFAQIGRKLILHRNIDAAIWQLDAALNYFPDSALLAAVRACAGLIRKSPIGTPKFSVITEARPREHSAGRTSCSTSFVDCEEHQACALRS